MVYDLTYGYIPTVYLPELEILVKKLSKSRVSQPYNIIEGQIEMIFLGHWKLDTQDLKSIMRVLVMRTKKYFISYIV